MGDVKRACELKERSRAAFDAQAAISVGRHITAPVQAKLPILRELLDRANN